MALKIKKIIDNNGQEIAPMTSTKAVFDENGNTVDSKLNTLEGKASQTYDNFAAIEASEDTNKDKVFIDAETNTSYRWNGEKYVSIGGGGKTLTAPIKTFIDLYPIIKKNCYVVYRFDDTGYYVMCASGITKLSLDFKPIFTINKSGSYNRVESGQDRNLLCKVGNKLFIASCFSANLVYMYDEDTAELTLLENPQGLQHYGSVYAVGDKIYYFHRYSKPHIYVYSAEDGSLLEDRAYDYGSIKITEGIAFTRDGYRVNLDTWEFEPITFPNAEPGTIKDLQYMFANGNILRSNSNISDTNNTYSYNFGDLGMTTSILCFNINRSATIIYNTNGKVVLRYPYGITNQVFRGIDSDYFGKDSINSFGATNYQKEVYVMFRNNVLMIDNISVYDTD